MSKTLLDDFFAQYPGFRYDNTAPVTGEFHRLIKHLKLSKEERVPIREDYKDALTKQFNAVYGTDLNDWDAWRHMCQMIDISPIPDTLEGCRKAVKSAHVNLVDFVDSPRTGETVRVFQTEYELSVYTKKSGKFFPQNNAYAGGILRYLLRHIIFPRDGPGGKRKRVRRSHQGI